MSEGLVYMRPLRLIGVHVPTSGTLHVLHAWRRLNEWILRKSLSHEVEVGYGLFGVGEEGCGYCAAIEQPEAVTRAEANELARMNLAGGAYKRGRFMGPVDEIEAQLEAMAATLGSAQNMRVDDDRPVVSIFLDIKTVKADRDVRSNLLIPARSTELSRSPRKVA